LRRQKAEGRRQEAGGRRIKPFEDLKIIYT